MSPRLPLLALVLAMAAADKVAAAPIPAVDVPALTAAADLIVVGRAVSVEPRSDRLVTVTIAVDRVAKGRLDGATVTLRYNAALPAARGVTAQRYGLFFLRQGAANAPWRLVDPSHPVLEALPDGAGPKAGAGGEPLVTVAGELAAVISAGPERLAVPAGRGAGDPTGEVQAIYAAAAAALRSLPPDLASDGLARAGGGAAPVARLWALAALTASESGMEETAVARLEAARAVLMDPPPELAPSVRSAAVAIESAVRAPGAVPVLVDLLGSGSPAVRRAAANALASIGGEDAVAALADRALADSDQAVRYAAILGLATATGSPDAPAFDAYRRQEAAVLARWRNWARNRPR